MSRIMEKTRKLPWRGILALIGGFFIQLTLGSFYSFGNMMTYLTSYMRKNGSPDLTYGDFIIVQSVWGMTQGISMPLSGFIIRFVGVRPAMFIGCTLFSLGTAATYFTLNQSVWMVAFTYGFVSAFGQGIALIPTMTIGMRWFPERKGMAMGVVVGGFGGGAFIFNQIQTAILNPNNIAPEGEYFTDPELLDRVPRLMLILGGIYLTIQMIACSLVTETHLDRELVPQDEREEEHQDVLMDQTDGEKYLTPRQAVKTRDFYLLWITRFCAVLITQSVSGFYKAFGQTFIADDHFLSFVGAVSSIFNCSGRLFYGLLMDKSNYRTAMMFEMVCLTLLVSSLPLTSYGGRILFGVWIWGVYFTFPGTFSTQPAVTTQAFGHTYGGTIYGFLFTSDIVNNFLVGALSQSLLKYGGWNGMFLCLSVFSLIAFIITLFFPKNPCPENYLQTAKNGAENDSLEKGLISIPGDHENERDTKISLALGDNIIQTDDDSVHTLKTPINVDTPTSNTPSSVDTPSLVDTPSSVDNHSTVDTPSSVNTHSSVNTPISVKTPASVNTPTSVNNPTSLYTYSPIPADNIVAVVKC